MWADLRPHDAVELAHGTQKSEHPMSALLRIVRDDASAECWTLDGKPLALLGLNRTGGGAHPWMLATAEMPKVGKTVTRVASARVRWWRERVMKKQGIAVWNIVLAESPNVRWLERIGFTLGAPFLRDCPNGERATYRPFWIA